MIRFIKKKFGIRSPSDEFVSAVKIGIARAAVENVDHPKHYNNGKIEVIDFIEDQSLGFCLGNAVKYIARAGKKNPFCEVEDLRKAVWYIQRRIQELQPQGGNR